MAAEVGRGIALELDPTRGLDGVEAPARARRPARAGREWGRGGDDGAVCRMEGGVAREEVEQVEAAAEDAVVGDEEHRVPYEAGTAGQVAAVEERHERRRARAGSARHGGDALMALCHGSRLWGRLSAAVARVVPPLKP